MNKKTQHLFWGIFLIVMGILFLVGNISRVGMDLLWPVFPLAVGILFWIQYLSDRKQFGLLMPGSILLVISLLFIYCNFEGWWRMEYLWPIFILAPSCGFFAMYFGGQRDQGLLIPGFILAGIGILFYFISVGFDDYWPVFLIAAGAIIILVQILKDRKKEGELPPPSE